MLNTLDNLSEVETLALTIIGESRGEVIEGQVAVANVIRNRSLFRNKPIKEICLQPEQFSCWNKNDPNYPYLLGIADNLIIGSKLVDPYLKQCVWIAQGIVSGNIMDNTHGAEYYLTNALMATGKYPTWAIIRVNERVIGTQTFFNA